MYIAVLPIEIPYGNIFRVAQASHRDALLVETNGRCEQAFHRNAPFQTGHFDKLNDPGAILRSLSFGHRARRDAEAIKYWNAEMFRILPLIFLPTVERPLVS